METVKTGIGLAVAVQAGAYFAGGATFIAVLPLGVFIGVSLIAGVGLNMLDSKFELKQRLQTALNGVQTSLEEGWYRLEAGALERLKIVKNSYENEVKRLGQQASRRVNHAVDSALDAALALALTATRRRAEEAARQLLGKRIR